jgi:hypothetical protein
LRPLRLQVIARLAFLFHACRKCIDAYWMLWPRRQLCATSKLGTSSAVAILIGGTSAEQKQYNKSKQATRGPVQHQQRMEQLFWHLTAHALSASAH